MPRISILDPTASPPSVNVDPGPPIDAALLANGRFGIRYDLTWKSFDWVRSEWESMLAEEGAAVESWCAGDRTGAAAESTLSELRDFAGTQDVFVSGLGN
ncbi:MAG: hypothetical protein AB8G23_10675 [Myxococcota bacterium]